MAGGFRLIAPRHVPPLEPAFRPAVLANRAFREEVAASGAGVPLVVALERLDGSLSRYDTVAFPDGHPRADANLVYAERLVKFLLWARGGWRVFVGGPASVGEHIRRVYASDGERKFDHHFMGEQVHGRPFKITVCAAQVVPAAREAGQHLGRHLDGCRIGFDLGASDRKVSAVVDGEAIFSEEIVWEPVEQTDPAYHQSKIREALNLAKSKMPRVDAIGGSSAGVIVDNRPMVASLFRGIPADRFGEIREMFLRFRDEFGVPLDVANDGDVTALAGAMSLDDNAVLGIAMGSSEAAGYVNPEGEITGWLNELAFAPVDYNPGAALTSGRATPVSARSTSRSSASSAMHRPWASRCLPTRPMPRSSSTCRRPSKPATRARGGSGRASASTWAMASPTTRTSTTSGTC